MTKKDEFGGFVSWNSYKMGKLPKNYLSWFLGGVTSNPITWDKTEKSLKKEHKGLLGKDLNIYPKSLTVKVKDGILWTSVPDIPGKFFLKFLFLINFFLKFGYHNPIPDLLNFFQGKNSPGSFFLKGAMSECPRIHEFLILYFLFKKLQILVNGF